MSPIVPCLACGNPISLDAGSCPRCGQPSVRKTSAGRTVGVVVLIVLAVVMMAATLGVPMPWTSRPEAFVECRTAGATLAGGMGCTIEHRAGSGPLRVCWDVNISCANRISGSAHGCGSVEPKGKSTTIVPYAEFRGTLDRCDQVAGSSITNLALK